MSYVNQTLIYTTTKTHHMVAWLVNIWTILVVSWVVKNEEAKLIPCSSSCVWLKIKLWHVMRPHEVSLCSFNKLHVDQTIPFSTLNQRALEGLYNHKVNMLNLVTYLDWTHVFEWYVVGMVPIIDMRLKGIGLYVLKTFIGSIVNMIGGTHMTTQRAWESSLWWLLEYIGAPRSMK